MSGIVGPNFTKDSGLVFGSGAVTREGGNTSEDTSNSTSAEDVLSSSAVSIVAGEPFDVRFGFKKTQGSGGAVGVGLKLNSTSPCNAATNDSRRPRSGTPSGNYNGYVIWHCAGRNGDYRNMITGMYASHNSTGGNDENGLCTATDDRLHDGTITTITIPGISPNSNVTVGVDDFHIYSMATS